MTQAGTTGQGQSGSGSNCNVGAFRFPELNTHHQIQFSVISRTPLF